jgi:predicted XRE-type DNA-binding protein
MKKRNINKLFGEEIEIKEICDKLSNLNFSGGSSFLPKNASLLEQSKYNLCQKILAHQQKKKLSTEKLANQIQLSIPETEDILHCRINKFTLDRLMDYAEKLTIPLQITETKPLSSHSSRKIIKSPRIIHASRKSSNGRLKKHL